MVNILKENKILWLVTLFLFSVNVYLALGGCDQRATVTERPNQAATSGCARSSQGTPK